MHKTVKIFLASSNELSADRKAFEDFLYQKSKLWLKQKEIFLELVNWEDFLDRVSKSRLQDEYNGAIKSCDIFVMLFHTKVGKYTNEEFETAIEHFKAHDKPDIFTYVKDVSSGAITELSLKTFLDKLDSLGHFPTHYDSEAQLLLHFSQQLDRLYGNETGAPVPPAPLLENSVREVKLKPKSELISLVNQYDFFAVFEELNLHFKKENLMLNGLIFEFTSQPNSFNAMLFANRIKTFISQYYNPQ
jgi:hypothetical protein